jgi:hypothetical protein
MNLDILTALFEWGFALGASSLFQAFLSLLLQLLGLGA